MFVLSYIYYPRAHAHTHLPQHKNIQKQFLHTRSKNLQKSTTMKNKNRFSKNGAAKVKRAAKKKRNKKKK